MREDAGIERLSLRYGRADRAVGIEPVHGDVARNVKGGEQILAGRIDGRMNRSRRQQRLLAVQF
jgi:hypothetical protein